MGCAQPATQLGPDDPPNLTLKSQKYHELRLSQTTPTFELAKVKSLMKSMKKREDEGGDSGVMALSAKAYRSLSTGGKFTYCMLHGENFGQNCDGMPAVLGEESKIFAQPPAAFWNEADWSDRQRNFLHSHRASVIGLLRLTIRHQHQIGVNLKKAILEIDAFELIPDIVAEYKRSSKDRDQLSVLSLLLKHARYEPYVKSPLYIKFYGEEASYQTAVPIHEDIVRFIIKCALSLYETRNG